MLEDHLVDYFREAIMTLRPDLLYVYTLRVTFSGIS
jgi:hypothetical protein